MAEKSSIFSKLLPKNFSKLLSQNDSENARKGRDENYFAKIVAHLLNTFPEILYAWLKDIDDTSEYRSLLAKREVYYPPLLDLDHKEASRIDIQIESQNRELLIFIEAKIDALENLDQLRRYAEQLDRQKADKKILLYVTRQVFPKFQKTEVCQRIPGSNVIFEHVDWDTLHQVLQAQPKNTLVDEVIAFMYEQGMGPNKNLTREYGANLSGLDLKGAGLQGVKLPKSNLQRTNLSAANLSGANLREANLQEADLTNATLTGADLTGANLCGTDLRGADLRETNLRTTKIDDKTKMDEKWQQVRRIVNDYINRQDLSGIDLSGGNLHRANLSGSILLRANLSGANLSETNLRDAKLQKANLSGAVLRDSNMRGANLSGADLREANLDGADLTWAIYDSQTQWPRDFILAESLRLIRE